VIAQIDNHLIQFWILKAESSPLTSKSKFYRLQTKICFMVYRAIGIVSGSSLNGLDIAFVELQETTGKWTAEIKAGRRIAYDAGWKEKLRDASTLGAFQYHVLNVEYGKYLAGVVLQFIEESDLHYKVQLIALSGHIGFYKADLQVCSQLGDGATIAALTGINVVSDVRSIDLALGGKGAPVFPVVDKLLFPGQGLFLHLGSNAMVSRHINGDYQGFDVCPANRLLDRIAARENKPFDMGGMMAAEGTIDTSLLEILNELEYYHMPLPKTLSADFATDVVAPLFDPMRISVKDALRTACEHIAMQVSAGVQLLTSDRLLPSKQLVVTGGGGNNDFLVQRIREILANSATEVVVPDRMIVNFREALAMALIGVLRWREENNVFGYITGARRDSIGGSVWIGQEA
jgi:anhydro-N-acetylmuramic acid kinase